MNQPTFIMEHPTEISPLARANDARPEVTERFELYIMGREIANGFSELNDAEDQAARFQSQASAKDAGDDEAMFYDADFLTDAAYRQPQHPRCDPVPRAAARGSMSRKSKPALRASFVILSGLSRRGFLR